MNTITYVTVNGAEGYANINAWSDKQRVNQTLFNPKTLDVSTDVPTMLNGVINQIRELGALPTGDIQWVQRCKVTDPYLQTDDAQGDAVVVVKSSGSISMVLQYPNPESKDTPFTYIGFDGEPNGLMAFMEEVNYTAQPAHIVDHITVGEEIPMSVPIATNE